MTPQQYADTLTTARLDARAHLRSYVADTRRQLGLPPTATTFTELIPDAPGALTARTRRYERLAIELGQLVAGMHHAAERRPHGTATNTKDNP